MIGCRIKGVNYPNPYGVLSTKIVTIILLRWPAILARKVPTVGCFQFPDYSEACLLQNVCVRQRTLFVSHPNLELARSDDLIDSYQNLPSSTDMKPNQLLPRRSFLSFSLARMNFTFPVKYAKRLGMLAAFDSDNDNIFHFSEKILFLQAYQIMNAKQRRQRKTTYCFSTPCSFFNAAYNYRS